MAAYLFVHFTGEEKNGEQIYFSVSQDGLHWKDLNDGNPVLFSQIGTCGVRDPFLVRHPQTGTVYLIATDLCIWNGNGWKDAQEKGSRSIIVWKTEDLVHWTKGESHEIGIPEAGCVWAPEAVFDREKGEFLVFFASKVSGKHKIYAAYTKDFEEFSETFLYIEKEMDVIDTTILEDNGQYYRISKDETDKRLVMEKSDSLTGEFVQQVLLLFLCQESGRNFLYRRCRRTVADRSFYRDGRADGDDGNDGREWHRNVPDNRSVSLSGRRRLLSAVRQRRGSDCQTV